MRLTSGHRRWVYLAAAVLFASGALWLVSHYFLQTDGQFGPAPHPLEQWWLRLHGAAAMLMLVVVGSLLPIHVRRGWHQRRNLPLGIALSSVLLLLTLSGYALYYFGGEEARAWISLFHWGIGVASALVLVWHVACGAVSRGAAFPRRKSADSTLRATRRAQRTGEPRAGEKKRRRETGGA